MHNVSIPDANWQRLFAAAVREQNPFLVAERFRSATFEILDRPLVGFGVASGIKCSKIAALAGLGVLFCASTGGIRRS